MKLLLPSRSNLPEGMMALDKTLRLNGTDNKTIRAHISGELVKIRDQDAFNEQCAPYGPNGLPFEEQYPRKLLTSVLTV